MKTDFLKNLGLNDEAISQIMAENGKDVNAEKEKITNLQKRYDDLETKFSTLKKSNDNVDDLKKKIEDFEKADRERKENEEKAQKESALKERFKIAVGDKKFLNDFTEKGILDEWKKALEDEKNAGKSDSDIYSELTKDREGIFKSENPSVDIPPKNPSTNREEIDDAEIRKIMGLPPKE